MQYKIVVFMVVSSTENEIYLGLDRELLFRIATTCMLKDVLNVSNLKIDFHDRKMMWLVL